jgi:predicted PurR-regulated permease PerM
MALRMLRQNRSGDEVIQLAIRLALLAALIYWCFVLVRPFIPILAWSVVLAVALYPLYSRLSEHLGNHQKLAATIITIIAIVIVIGPATWLVMGLVEGLQVISDQLDAGRLVLPSPPAVVRDLPVIGGRLYELWSQASADLEAVLTQFSPHLKPLIRPTLTIVGGAGIGALEFLASVIVAGFLFPSGPRLVAASKNMVARLMPQSEEDFVALAGATIRSVSQGVVGIALLQSFLFGIGLSFAGIPHAGLLAFVVLVLAIVQIGAAIVLIPCVIWIWMTSDVGMALLLTVYLVLVGLADNVLKPLLMGRGLTTPMPVIFIGLLGGTFAHGIVGLFIGPIILAVAWELMMAWIRTEQAREAAVPTEPLRAEREGSAT